MCETLFASIQSQITKTAFQGSLCRLKTPFPTYLPNSVPPKNPLRFRTQTLSANLRNALRPVSSLLYTPACSNTLENTRPVSARTISRAFSGVI